MQSDFSWRWWTEIDPGKRHTRNLSHSSWPLGNLREGIYNLFVLYYWQRHRNMLYLLICLTVSHYFIALWFILASKFFPPKELVFYQQQFFTWAGCMARPCLQWDHPDGGCYFLGASKCDLCKWCYWGVNNLCVTSNTKSLHTLSPLWYLCFLCIIWMLYGTCHRATCWGRRCSGSSTFFGYIISFFEFWASCFAIK